MGLGTVLTLKSMLTARNLQFLSILLDIVLAPTEVGRSVWRAFGARFSSSAVADEARSRLTEIKRIVDDYRGKL